jgi:ABC-type antimicrobial peptide transport system permease subunit
LPLLGAVALIFLIACLNIGNLMISHCVSREREFAIPISLGAGRVRLVRLVVTEAIVIALVGTVLGIGGYRQMTRSAVFRRPFTS